MKSIADLINSFVIPDEHNVSIITEGYGIWFTWENILPPDVTQIFQDYGGVPVITVDGQSLWFFFSTEVLLALAKLSVWVKFNPTAMLVEAFPTSLVVDTQKNLSLQIEDKIAKQTFNLQGEKLTVLVHPELQVAGGNYPGLTYDSNIASLPELVRSKLSPSKWGKMTADTRLPYASSQGWYCIIHPLGNQLDKNFQAGWRYMFAEIEAILQRVKVRYSLFDTYLVVPIEHLSMLREWTRELVTTLFSIKDNTPDKYWPCVSALVDKKGLNFNNELPQKINVQWDALTPNFPYMNYRNAYLLGEGFHIQDLNFSSGKSSISQWCTVVHDSYSFQANRIPVLLPDKFVSGNQNGCFYCGIKSHESAQCPSKSMAESSLTFWQDFSNVDIDAINETFRAAEVQLSKDGVKAFKKILAEESITSQVLEGVFSINSIIQLRSMERIWLLSGKEIDSPADPSAYREESQCWDLLKRLRNTDAKDVRSIEKEVVNASVANPRDWRLKSLLGFISIEKNDYQGGLRHWKEAESHTSSILHQAWHYFLMARTHEITGRFDDAMELYNSTQKILPYWPEPAYRRLVCRVKMGFAEQIQGRMLEVIKETPSVFNKILLDPELERGHLPIMAMLYPSWLEALEQSALEKGRVAALLREVDEWFFTDHPIASIIRTKIQELINALEVRNYLAFQTIVNIRPKLEEEISRLRTRELEELKNTFKGFLSSLEVVRDEASWFPFPNTLVKFNKDFNECATILNWAFTSNFNTPENFKRAKTYVETTQELLGRLEVQLTFIRTIRDVTLFVLLLLKTFLWVEIVCLVVSFVFVVVVTFFGGSIGLSWLQRLITANFWDLQRVLVGVVSATALGIAILSTVLVFDKRRETMLDNAKQQREQFQQQRLAKVKEQKRLEQAQKEQSQEI